MPHRRHPVLHRLCATVVLSVGALLSIAALPAMAAQSNKWRLQFSGAAESAGELVFEIVPVGKTPVRVTVAIERNDGENRVARKVKTAIDRQAGDWVDAELDDGEDVLVKRHFFRRFSIVLVSSTVKDVRINFDQE
ncbi:hypothetical protein [Lysobacter hankyongensis]|uniref:Uncharacterized protein n=1 Tax=Lysobacter hankyongensis TaxID=1176535 RepID=A0ABP9BXT4_9GAMM